MLRVDLSLFLRRLPRSAKDNGRTIMAMLMTDDEMKCGTLNIQTSHRRAVQYLVRSSCPGEFWGTTSIYAIVTGGSSSLSLDHYRDNRIDGLAIVPLILMVYCRHGGVNCVGPANILRVDGYSVIFIVLVKSWYELGKCCGASAFMRYRELLVVLNPFFRIYKALETINVF